MDSFALAYIPSNNDDSGENKEHFFVKVHINLWTQCGWDDETPVLDIGLMLSHLSDAKKIRLYIPFHIETENLGDLCERLSKDANLLGAVFNEPYTSTDITATKRAVVTKGISKAPEFILYKLDFSSTDDVILSSYKNGTGTFLEFNPQVIKSPSKENSCDKYYLRFRIQSKALTDCVREYQVPNRYFETLVNSTYMIDMRFNNTRSMDLSLVQQLTQSDCHLAPIVGLHFLLMAKVDVDVYANGAFHSSRVLEKDIWNSYVKPKADKKRATEDIIAYHSSKKAGSNDTDIGSWEFFARLKAGRCSAKTIIPYLVLLILINVGCNFAFNIWLTELSVILPNRLPIIKQVASLIVIIFIAWFLMHSAGRKQKNIDNLFAVWYNNQLTMEDILWNGFV